MISAWGLYTEGNRAESIDQKVRVRVGLDTGFGMALDLILYRRECYGHALISFKIMTHLNV